MQAELYNEYRAKVVPALSEKLGYKNVLQVPRIQKVVVNTCIPANVADLKQALEDAKRELAVVTGQRAAETRAKKSISNFKLRKGQVIGAKVTLRGDRMYEFLERLIKMALPRIRDFRGVSGWRRAPFGPLSADSTRLAAVARVASRLRVHRLGGISQTCIKLEVIIFFDVNRSRTWLHVKPTDIFTAHGYERDVSERNQLFSEVVR